MESPREPNLNKVNNSVEANGERKSLFTKLITFLTVEPYLFCYIFSRVIAAITLEIFKIEKACRTNLNYTEEICAKVVAGDYSDNITTKALVEASTLVEDMTAWVYPIKTVIPAIYILFVGAWSDRTGNRKALLLTPIIGDVASLIGLIIGIYYFLEWPLWAMGLIEAMSSTFIGGFPVALMGSYSYIADVTSIESRTFRISVVLVIVTLCIQISASTGRILTQAVGYYGVYGIGLVFYVVGFIYTMFRIHDVRRIKTEGTFLYKLGQFFHVRNVWDTVSLLLLSRGRKLAQILLIIWARIFIMGPIYGEDSVIYSYTFSRYHMDIVDFRLFYTYSGLMRIAGTVIAIPVFSKWLKMHDTMLSVIATTSKVTSSLLYGLAPTREWFFVGPVFDIFTSSGLIAILSLGTKIVDPDEVGKMYSIFWFIDSVLILIYEPMYSKLFEKTKSTLPGAVCFLSSIMTFSNFIIFIILYRLHKKQAKDTVQNPQSKEMHAYENDVTAL